jgi:shikimate dehydrogenase
LTTYGLIGWPLGHSFSKKYFEEKFLRENITDVAYELFPIERIEGLAKLLEANPTLKGLNVTIPYKQSVLPFLHSLDETAAAVQAVNCIKIDPAFRLKGYNTDVIGFEESLRNIPISKSIERAYLLGTGGAAKALGYVLQKMNIPHFYVSRNARLDNEISYSDIKKPGAVFNCTPLGMYPETQQMPPFPLDFLLPGILVYDLVYNPSETLLLQQARERGCVVKNGLEMLHLQAEAAWKIWQT